MWLEEEKRAKLLTILHGWLWAGSHNCGIRFGEFESVIVKVRHRCLPPSQAARDSSHRATVSYKNAPRWFISIATSPFMRQCQTAELFYRNHQVVQRGDAN